MKPAKAYPWAYALAFVQLGLATRVLASREDPTIYLVLCGVLVVVGFVNHRAHEHLAEQESHRQKEKKP